jgi:TRAP-type C4-dicarboxylate transport system permease large subunit
MFGFTTDPLLVMLLVNLCALVVGVVMGGGAAAIVLAPVLSQVEIHPLLLSVVMVIHVSIGLLTPTVGVRLSVFCSPSWISLERSVHVGVPFLVVETGVLSLVSYVLWVVLFTPKPLGYL